MRRRSYWQNPKADAVRDALNKAFKKLRQDGYVARQNTPCCNSCSIAEIEAYCMKTIQRFQEDPTPANERRVRTMERYVFWHAQNRSELYDDGHVWLAWSSPEPMEIVNRLIEEGLTVVWNKTESMKIYATYGGELLDKGAYALQGDGALIFCKANAKLRQGATRKVYENAVKRGEAPTL